MRYSPIFTLIILGAMFSCRVRNVAPGADEIFKGKFKAQEVKEGDLVVYRQGSAKNIVPGYAQFRLTFSGTKNEKKVNVTEFTGERFDGIWSYDGQLLTIGQLSPQPASGTFVYKVESMTAASLVLTNSLPNPKTGETINRLMLVPE